MNKLMCKTMYCSERALMIGYKFNFKTRIKTSIVSLTYCDLHNFAKWMNFCSFCCANFQELIWGRTTTYIIWHFSIWHVSCLTDLCTPTGSSIQVVSATFGSCLVLIPELHLIRASAFSVSFFFQKIKCCFVTYGKILCPFSIPLPVWVFPKQLCLEISSSAILMLKNFSLIHLPRLGYQFVPGRFCI